MRIPPLRFCAINPPEAIRKIQYCIGLSSWSPPIAPVKRNVDSAYIFLLQFRLFPTISDISQQMTVAIGMLRKVVLQRLGRMTGQFRDGVAYIG